MPELFDDHKNEEVEIDVGDDEADKDGENSWKGEEDGQGEEEESWEEDEEILGEEEEEEEESRPQEILDDEDEEIDIEMDKEDKLADMDDDGLVAELYKDRNYDNYLKSRMDEGHDPDDRFLAEISRNQVDHRLLEEHKIFTMQDMVNKMGEMMEWKDEDAVLFPIKANSEKELYERKLEFYIKHGGVPSEMNGYDTVFEGSDIPLEERDKLKNFMFENVLSETQANSVLEFLKERDENSSQKEEKDWDNYLEENKKLLQDSYGQDLPRALKLVNKALRKVFPQALEGDEFKRLRNNAHFINAMFDLVDKNANLAKVSLGELVAEIPNLTTQELNARMRQLEKRPEWQSGKGARYEKINKTIERIVRELDKRGEYGDSEVD